MTVALSLIVPDLPSTVVPWRVVACVVVDVVERGGGVIRTHSVETPGPLVLSDLDPRVTART